MKKHIFRLILSGFLLLPVISFGQNTNYPVTSKNGIEYYQYTVQSSEGLLSIGRKFNIPADEIIKANPDVKDGLKIGQHILIPVTKKSGEKAAKQKKTATEFIQHKVEKKQTLFSISRKYKVSEEEIVKYNPEIEKGLKEGMILQIPKALKDSTKKETEKPTNTEKSLSTVANNKTVQLDKNDKKSKYRTHVVQQDETLFSISRRYKVEIPDVVQLNPGSDSKLVVGSELRIPAEINPKAKAQKKDSSITSSTSPKEEPKIVEKLTPVKYTDHKTIKIGFLLPLMLDLPKNDPTVDRFVNYYAGSLLAIKEAKQKGISFEIYTYDTEKSEDRVKEILNNPELKTVDLIIGPAFSNQVQLVADFAKENKINTLIPFTSKVPDIESNPYLFQFNPGQDTELKSIFELITGKYKNMNIVFAEIQDVNPSDEGKIRVDVLQQKLTKEHRHFATIELANSDNVNFSNVLKKGEKNLIIFNSDKFSTVSPFLNSIISRSTLFDIVLFEQFNWKNQADKALQSIYLSPFVPKINTESMIEFNSQFDQYFGRDVASDSPRYDLLGYDLANYFISVIHRYGNKFGNKINSANLVKGIQSDPLFERSSYESGFINQRVYLGEDKAQ